MKIDQLASNIKWWETKRWIFNVIVGLAGTYSIYDMLSRIDYVWTLADTIGIIWWGIGANIFYSLGILTELFDWYYFKNKIGFVKGRWFFFIIGILFSCYWTSYFTWQYFLTL